MAIVCSSLGSDTYLLHDLACHLPALGIPVVL